MKIEINELTCIGCPSGCGLKVRLEDGKVASIEGYGCPKGKIYANKECTNPTRFFTSTIPVESGEFEVVSVKTSTDIPKSKIMECRDALRGVKVKAPVKIGDVIVRNVAGTCVDIVASKNVAVAR